MILEVSTCSYRSQVITMLHMHIARNMREIKAPINLHDDIVDAEQLHLA